MMKKVTTKLTLDQRATYQIIVPGQLDESWSDWDESISITVGHDQDGMPVTILTVTCDQAALQGLLRRLYSRGLPLISLQLLKVS